MVDGWMRTAWTNQSGRIPTGWRSEAACRDLPPGLFFGDHVATLHESRRLCRVCPVQAQCAIASIVEDIETDCYDAHGIRGGLFAKERLRVRREVERRLPARALPTFSVDCSGLGEGVPELLDDPCIALVDPTPNDLDQSGDADAVGCGEVAPSCIRIRREVGVERSALHDARKRNGASERGRGATTCVQVDDQEPISAK